MALGMLTASQGVICALIVAECCVGIPDVHHCVIQALQALASDTHAMEHLPGGPWRNVDP